MTKNRIIIIGAGGFGKEVLKFAIFLGYEVVGFLDDTPEKQNTNIYNVPVLGFIDDYEKYNCCSFILAIGNSRGRDKIVQKISGKVNFVSLINKEVDCEINNIGKGVIIMPGVVVSAGVTIKDFSIINMNAVVSHDCFINDYCTIAPGAVLTGNCILESHVEIGAGAVILPSINLGEQSMVSAGAVVMSNLSSKHMAIGNPARIIKRKEFDCD